MGLSSEHTPGRDARTRTRPWRTDSRPQVVAGTRFTSLRLTPLRLAMVLAALAAAPAVHAQAQVWDVGRQCWRAEDAANCGQQYDVGSQQYSGGAANGSESAPETESTATPKGAEKAPAAASANTDESGTTSDMSAETLKKVQKRARKLKRLGTTGENILQDLDMLPTEDGGS